MQRRLINILVTRILVCLWEGTSRFSTSGNLFQSCILLKYDRKSKTKSLSGSILEKAGKSKKFVMSLHLLKLVHSKMVTVHATFVCRTAEILPPLLKSHADFMASEFRSGCSTNRIRDHEAC